MVTSKTAEDAITRYVSDTVSTGSGGQMTENFKFTNLTVRQLAE